MYRISPSVARNQFVASSLLTLLVLVFYAVKSLPDDGEKWSTMVVLVAVAVGGGFFYWRIYKQGVAFAASHTLNLGSDSILLRDGATETKIPYSAIELLKVRRPYVGKANFILKVTDLPAVTHYGYEDIEGLRSALASRLPRDRVVGRVVHA